MNNARRSARTPIPWNNTTSELLVSWEWETDHLKIVILGEGPAEHRMFNWKIYQKNEANGTQSVFDEGMGVSFQESADQAIEIVSKSWPRHFGYAKYAGHLAYTFAINGGRQVNFQSMVGKECVLHVIGNQKEPATITGVLGVKNYDITITRDKQVIVIPPRRVTGLENNQGVSLVEPLTVRKP